MTRDIDNRSNLTPAEAGSTYPEVINITTPFYTLTAVEQTAIITTSTTALNIYLPMAAGIAGLTYRLIKTNTDFTYLTTITPNGADTIDGLASITMMTENETYVLTSDGSNWLIMEHFASTDWINGGTVPLSAVTTAPTKPDIVTADKYYYRRQGKDLHINLIFSYTSSAGSSAGTGDYLLSLPTGLTFDTNSNLVFYNTTGFTNWEVLGSYVGRFMLQNTTNNTALGGLVCYDSTKLRFFLYIQSYTANVWGSGYMAMGSTNMGLTANFVVPIAEFNQ